MTIRKTTRILLTFAVAMAMTILAAIPTFAGTTQFWGNTTYNKHFNHDENITISEVDEDGTVLWENIAYCFNMQDGYPFNTGDASINTYENLGEQSDATWRAHAVNKNYDGDMKDVLTKVVYIGFPYDGSNEIKTILKEQCKVSDDYLDDAFRAATQKAVWHVTDNRPFRAPSEGTVPTGNTSAQVSEYIAKLIYEKAVAFTGDTGLNLRLWDCNGAKQNLLDTMSNIMPEEPQQPETPEPQNPEPENPEPENPEAEEFDIQISKVNLGGENISGAQIQITDADNNIIKEYESTETVESVKLEAGTYTFHEEAAPNGYLAVSDFVFTVAEDGTVTLDSVDSNVAEMIDGVLVVTDQYENPVEPKESEEPQNPEPENPDSENPKPQNSEVKGIGISKVDIAGTEIAGAHIVIKNSDDVTVEEWVSKKGETHYMAVEPGTYTFHEEAAPDGYKAVTDIKFSVDSDGKITVVSANGNTVKVDEVTGNLVVTDEYLEQTQAKKSKSNTDTTTSNSNSTKNNIVETGDNANMILYIMLMVGSLMGLGGLLVLKRD